MDYLDGIFCLLEHIFEVTEPLRNTLVGSSESVRVSVWCRCVLVIHWPLVAVSPSNLARILPWMYATYLDVSTYVKFLNGL